MKTINVLRTILRFKFVVTVIVINTLQANLSSTKSQSRIPDNYLRDVDLESKAILIEQIQKEYPKIFEIAIQRTDNNQCIYFPNGVNMNLPIDHFMFDFITKYYALITVLQSHFSSLGNYFEFNSFFQQFNCNQIDVKYNYYENLRLDEKFNTCFLTLFNNYLKAYGSTIANFSPLPKTQITIDSLLTVASKFFDIGILENGQIDWLFAVWQNPYKNMDEAIKGTNAPLIAGFCFYVMHLEQGKMRNEILEIKKIIEKQAKFYLTSSGGIERYTFFYQELQGLMKKSEFLKSILISHYNENKNLLNFELHY